MVVANNPSDATSYSICTTQFIDSWVPSSANTMSHDNTRIKYCTLPPLGHAGIPEQLELLAEEPKELQQQNECIEWFENQIDHAPPPQPLYPKK